MNTTVTASNMQVKAVANQGILINEIATANDTNWDNAATTNQTGGISLRATSTADTKTWVTATSKKSASAASATSSANSADLNGTYTTLTTTASQVAAVAGSNAEHNVYYVDDNGTSGYQDGEGYYVKYTYYLKSSADALALSTAAGGQTLNISNVTVEGNTNTANLDKAIRVAVVLSNNAGTTTKAYIFAPLYDAAQTYYVGTTHATTTTLTGSQPTVLDELPATTSNGVAVNVYIYFEGEDANLKTDNIVAALDNLTVSVDFSLVTNAAAVTDAGVTVPTT